MTTHSSVLAWRIPWMEEPCGLPCTGSHRVRHDWSDLAAAAAAACGPKSVNTVCTISVILYLVALLLWSASHSVVSDSLWSYGLYSPWNSLGLNTGVSGLSLLQGIFPTQGSNPGHLHGRQILYQLSHKRSHALAILNYLHFLDWACCLLPPALCTSSSLPCLANYC